MIAPPGTPAPCSICGAARTRHDAVKGPTCASIRCQTEVSLIQQREENERFDQKCEAFAQSFGDSLGTTDHITARVPYLDRPVVTTPEARKRAFREALRESLRETFRDASDGGLAPIHAYEDGVSDPVVDASCIACRGFCCRQGAGHAFLNRTYLPSVLNRRPADSPATVYRDYVGRIPNEAMEDSCVYQGNEGCVLPRNMRADICNDYECSGRQALKGALSEAQPSGVVVVAMDGEAIKAAASAARDAPLDWLPVPSEG